MGSMAPRTFRLAGLLLALIGVTSGACFRLNGVAGGTEEVARMSRGDLARLLLPGAVAFTALLFGLRHLARRLVARSSLPEAVKARYPKYDVLCYLPFLAFGLGAWGVRFPLPTAAVVLGLALVAAQAALVHGLLGAEVRRRAFSSFQWLAFLFSLSGFAALIYQIVWQRVLFGLFGVNIESVTVTVSVFMLGLGVGSLVGGLLSKRFPGHAPQLFLLCETAIGLFGALSLPLIEWVGEATLHGSPLTVALATYALLCLPTLGMGATLPILVGYLNQRYASGGRSVGLLYFLNTVGSAVACFLTADVLFVLAGLQAAVLVAAACNLLVAALVYRYCRRLARPGAGAPPDSAPAAEVRPTARAGGSRREFVIALLVAGATGYVSLSQEILWFRAVGYVTGGRPDVFAYVLGFFLFGVAFGALLAQRVCRAGKAYAAAFLPLVLALSGVAFELSLPLSAKVLTLSPSWGVYACYLAVTVIALLVGSVFPVVCHYGIDGRPDAGLLLSWVYFANIVGAVAGPLLTGFVLLELFPLGRNVLFLAGATLALAAGTALAGLRRPALRLGAVLGAFAALAVLVRAQDGLYAHLLEKLQYKDAYASAPPYRYVVENRSGIIAVAPGDPDVVYGGGSYDGRFSTDPVADRNMIRRAYMVAALHPEPAEVLEIGLSSGSWARVVADHEAVRKLTVVEINPGYLGLLDRYPEVASLRRDPRVEIHTDDGRRWLRRHPEARFDFILMNTTFHWRDHITNLLSAEFLGLCRAHLKPGGVVYYNTTGSEDVRFTAAAVFAHVTRYKNFVAASDAPFAMTPDERRANLLRFRRQARGVFDPSVPQTAAALQELVAASTADEGPALRGSGHLRCITDDNMATEFKARNEWCRPNGQWGRPLLGSLWASEGN
jgi:spermidine synthase